MAETKDADWEVAIETLGKNFQEKNAAAALLKIAKENDVLVDESEYDALNAIIRNTPVNQQITDAQKKLFMQVYKKLPPSTQWPMRNGGYKKTKKRRRKSRKKTNKKRKKKTNKKRRYKHTGGNKCKCCKCCKKRKPKKKSRKRR
ncbi:MAG: hypothetical protein CMA27_06560 [Euryarchaeota archaeon]|nr:hypothetical protein [Euryarchaeota archaeon]